MLYCHAMNFRSKALLLIQSYRRSLVKKGLWTYDERIHKISSHTDCELLGIIKDIIGKLTLLVNQNAPLQTAKLLRSFNELCSRFIIHQNKVVDTNTLCSNMLLELIQMPGSKKPTDSQKKQLAAMAKFIVEHGTTQQQHLFYQSAQQKFPASAIPADLQESANWVEQYR